MRLLSGLLLTVSLIAGSDVLCFDNAKLGTLPPGWTVAMTHAGGAPRWEVVRDDSAPTPPQVLAQVSTDATAGRFPLAIWGGATLRNGEVKVAFKTVAGKVDQAAGLVWRYRDQNNYYIARANALERNVVLYKVENGTRLSIAPKGLPSRSYGVKHEVPRDRWNTLRVVFQDQTFIVFLNNEHLLEAEDATLTGSGKTGLWTKADSVTYFDDFTVSGYEAKP
jgi:hypothetical protein